MKSLIVIPARVASTRFPNKPFAVIAGVPMIERVWRIAKSIEGNNRVVIATDQLEAFSAMKKLGAEVVASPETCASGSDRAAYVLQSFNENFDAVVSFQGDAVLTPPWIVEDILDAMAGDSEIQIATPAVELRGQALTDFILSKQKGSSTGTSVVFNELGNALYFSKTALPNFRNINPMSSMFRHIGTYAYRAPALKTFSSLPPSRLELAEGLEQLRALENCMDIRVVRVDYRGRTHASVDNPEDVAIVEEIIKREGELI